MYVFERKHGDWQQRAKLTPTDGERYDQFGSAVALKDGTAVISARGWKDKQTDVPGEAYIFERGSTGWTERAHFTPGDASTRDWFALDAAVADELALVNNLSDNTTGEWAGAVHAFELADKTWSHSATLTAPDGDAHDRYSAAVALSGRTALVGAAGDEDPNGEETGAAYVHHL